MAGDTLTTSLRRAFVSLAVASTGLLWGPPACAAGTESFGSPGSGAGQLDEPFGVAVDRANGDVYVVDTNNQRVERFSSDGVFRLAWGWGVRDGRTPAMQRCETACHAGLAGAGAGQLGFAEGLAIDDDKTSASYGDVYVVDIGNHRVQKFSADGQFLLTFGWGVNQTAREDREPANEDVCPVHPGDRCGPGTQGSGPGQFEFPVEGHFISVGSDGTVYVGDRSRVQAFAPDGVYESQVRLSTPRISETGENGGVSGLEVSPGGDLYTIRVGVRSVNEYEPSGGFLRSIDAQVEPENPEGPTPVVAIDAAEDVFVVHDTAEEHYVRELDPAGAEIATFAVPVQAGLHGIAYDERTRRLYVLDTHAGAARVLVLASSPRHSDTTLGADLVEWLNPQET